MEMGSLLEGRYAACEQVIVVCDNLNTHTQGAFDEVFDPERARRLVRRLEFRHTPKHGSWLNIAENSRQKGVDWQMKVADTRIKLISAYPKIMA